MLIKIRGNGKVEPVTTQPHECIFHNWTQSLSPTEFQGICDTLNDFLNHKGSGEIVTSRCLKDPDWTHTPYLLIYESVGRNSEMASFLFSLIVWRVMMNRPETWALGRYPRQMVDVISLTYFRVSIN